MKCSIELQAPWRIAAGEEGYKLLETNLLLKFQGWQGLLGLSELQVLEKKVEEQFACMNLKLWEQPKVFWRVQVDEVAGAS